MSKKLLNPDQLVFPFLRDDPAYEANLLRSRIAREVERGIQTKLTDRLSEIIVTICYQLMDQKIKRAIDDAVAPLQRNFRDLANYVEERRADDPADWWKKNGETHDTDDELPF